MNRSVLLLPIAALVGAAAPSQTPASAPTAAALEWKGQYGGEPEGADVVMNAVRWSMLWRGLERSAPALDFTNHFAVVAYAGERPTGGFTIEFLEPVPQGDDLLIRWRVRSPSPETYTTQAIAHPWKVKAFLRPKGKVKLEQEPQLSW